MADRKLVVELIGDASSLEKAFGRSSQAGSRFGSGLKNLGKVAAVGVGAAFVGLAATLKVGFGEMEQGQKVSAQTGAVLKSTGGSAKVTQKQVEGLAGSLMQLSGVDDEAIQSGENMLLTFTNIRNEAGKGNDVFDQTTKTLLDMSTALGTDMNKSAIQLGKALQDPIKGITALTRVGVSFTEQQKDQIKGMVEAGDTMGAQKLILAELNKEFGGSAEAVGKTLPGQLSILKESFNNAAGAIVETLIPYLMQLSEWTVKHMPEIQATIQAVMTGIVASIEFVAPIIATLIGWFEKLATFAEIHWGKVQEVADRVMKWYQGTLGPAIDTILGGIIALWDRFGGAITKVTETAFTIVFTIVKTVLGNISSVVNAVMAILRGDWSDAWKEISEIPGRMLSGVEKILRSLITGWKTIAVAIGGAVLEGLIDGLKGLGHAMGALAVDAGQAFVAGIKFGLSQLAQALESTVKVPLNALISAWNAIGIPGMHVHIPVPFAPDIDFNTPTIGLPDIPLLAKGGIVTGPTLAMIGEKRRPEAVIPLDSARGKGMLGGSTYVFNFPNYVGTQEELGQAMRQIVGKYLRDNGGSYFPA